MILKVITKFFKKYKKKQKGIIKINGNIIRIDNDIESLQINNGNIFINGKKLKNENKDEKVINVAVYGLVEKIDVDRCNEVKVDGNVNYLKNTSGEMFIKGDVYSATTVSGNINCKSIIGSANSVSGNISKRI